MKMYISGIVLLMHIMQKCRQVDGNAAFVQIASLDAKMMCQFSENATFDGISEMQCIHRCLKKAQCHVINYLESISCEIYETFPSSCKTVTSKNWTAMILNRTDENVTPEQSEVPRPIDPSKNAPLGLEDRRIADYQMSTSSDYATTRRAFFGRLRSPSPWCAAGMRAGEFLRVDFQTRKVISSIEMQGHPMMDFWVTSYKLYYSEDSYSFTSYQENGHDKVFTGPSSRNNVAKTDLPYIIKAFSILINPQSINGYVLCIRMELIGQEDPEQPAIPHDCLTPVKALGMASGVIADSAINASSVYDQNSIAANGRLNRYTTWRSKKDQNGPNEYLQVDFPSEKIIYAIATQGHHGFPYWVTSYEISYGPRSDQLTEIMKNNSTMPKRFTANSDARSIVKNKLEKPIRANVIRINVKGLQGSDYSMRAEIYGCEPKN